MAKTFINVYILTGIKGRDRTKLYENTKYKKVVDFMHKHLKEYDCYDKIEVETKIVSRNRDSRWEED